MTVSLDVSVGKPSLDCMSFEGIGVDVAGFAVIECLTIGLTSILFWDVIVD